MTSAVNNDSTFDIDDFKEEFSSALAESSGYLYQRVRSDEVRFNIWEGQSEDGRKWSSGTGSKAPFPWEGAADTRTFFVDQCINELVEMKVSALKRARIQTTPVGNSSALPESTLNTQVLTYMVKNKIAEEWVREWEALLQWTETYGLACMSVYWRRETDTESVTVSIQDIIQLAQQDQVLGDMMQKITSIGVSEDDYKALQPLFDQYFPGAKAKSAIKSLMAKGEFSYDKEYLRVNRPTVRALRVMEDIFFPINTFALQEAPWVVRRDICTATELKDRARLEDWDENFTKQLLTMKGSSIVSATYYNTWKTRVTNNVFIDDVKNKFEVFYVYTHESDEKGQRKTYETVFHPSLANYGKRELFDYDHGKFPFVDFPRERVTRSILESRGIPQIIGPIQSEIKLQRDSRIDRTSLATLPPLKVPLGRGRIQINMGPSTQIPVGPSGDVSWLNPPPMDSMSLETETLLSNDARSYCGQYNDAADPNRMLLRQQTAIDRTLSGAKEVCTQIFQLCQQYISDEDVQKVTGQPGYSMHADRESIQGEFELAVEFDARDLNMEFLTAKIKAINEIVAPNDTSGSIDRNFLTQWSAQAVDPTFARLGIKSEDSATQKEVQDEKNNLTQICCGIEPPMVPKGQNYQLRLQTLQNTIQQSPSVQTSISQDPNKQAILENRMKFLSFQVQQQQNANTGRLGTKPIQQ